MVNGPSPVWGDSEDVEASVQLTLPLMTKTIGVTSREGQRVDLLVGKRKQCGRKEHAFIVWMRGKQEDAPESERRADRAEERRGEEHEQQRREHANTDKYGNVIQVER